jgi:hypothetical protein
MEPRTGKRAFPVFVRCRRRRRIAALAIGLVRTQAQPASLGAMQTRSAIPSTLGNHDDMGAQHVTSKRAFAVLRVLLRRRCLTALPLGSDQEDGTVRISPCPPASLSRRGSP